MALVGLGSAPLGGETVSDWLSLSSGVSTRLFIALSNALREAPVCRSGVDVCGPASGVLTSVTLPGDMTDEERSDDPGDVTVLTSVDTSLCPIAAEEEPDLSEALLLLKIIQVHH